MDFNFITDLKDSFLQSKFVDFLKLGLIYLALGLAALLVVLLLVLFVHFIFAKLKFKTRIVNLTRIYPEKSKFKIFFIEFPRAFWRDFFCSDPNIFPYYGLNLICGDQGCGKTITMCYLIRKWSYEFPKLRVRTNFDCSVGSHDLFSYKDFDNCANGIYGELDCLSELQTWFSSQDSKYFPPEMLSVITQQRHVRRCIIGDTQRFHRVAKQLREQTSFIYYPKTFFGCLTFVRVIEPDLDDDGKIISERVIKKFWFVHDDELRKMYDSYSLVDFGQK